MEFCYLENIIEKFLDALIKLLTWQISSFFALQGFPTIITHYKHCVFHNLISKQGNKRNELISKYSVFSYSTVHKGFSLANSYTKKNLIRQIHLSMFKC